MDERDRELVRLLQRVTIAAAIALCILLGVLVVRLNSEAVVVNAQFPEKVQFLFRPARFKVLWGGRAGIKSWSMARALLVQGVNRPLRVPCARETMQSIQDSVHALLEDQIQLLQLSGHYRVYKSAIVGANGTEFTFHGLRDLSVHNIKSLEGADILWAEEAQNITENSWLTVVPTIRKPGSEIWVSFNPRYATDATYRRFVLQPDSRAVVVRTSWRDNPWLSEESRMDMESDKARDHDNYLHVWEGHCQSSVEGAIYKTEIAQMEKEGRISKVPYDRFVPVDTFWDLGYGDMVSVWFAQVSAMQYRVLDYYQNSGKAIDHYLQVLQHKDYTYGRAVLPWDGGSKQLGTGRSIQEIMRAKGFNVRVLPRWLVADGINAVRTIFPQLWFDSERCQLGLQGLREYQWGPSSATGVSPREPLHNEASHPADALRSLAVALKAPEREEKRHDRRPPPRLGPDSWMA